MFHLARQCSNTLYGGLAVKTRYLFWSLLVITCAQLVYLITLASHIDDIRNRAALHHKSPAVRAAAIRALPNGCCDDLLIERLHDDDADVRLVAVAKIGDQFGYNSRGANPAQMASALAPLLDDDHKAVRREVAWSLSAIGADAWPVVQSALRDDNARVRLAALQAIDFTSQWKVDKSFAKNGEVYRIVEPLSQASDAEVRNAAAAELKWIDWRLSKQHSSDGK